MKKGFSLIEILVVIIILGVIGLIVFPTVNFMIKQSKEDLYKDQIEEIKLASEKWAYKNTNLLPSVEGDSVTLTLLELKRSGFIQPDIRDPRNDEPLSNGLLIVITYTSNDYEYTIKEPIESSINIDNLSVISSGDAIKYVEINTDFVLDNVVVKDENEKELEVIITYYDNGKEISKIDTSILKTYTVEYSILDENKNTVSICEKTIIVHDSIEPTITLPDKVTITSSLALNYDLMEGVEIIDNSGKEPTITINGFDNSVGEKIVSYEACDSSNNCSTKNRIIVIE